MISSRFQADGLICLVFDLTCVPPHTFLAIIMEHALLQRCSQVADTV